MGTFKSSSLNVLKTSVLELVNIDAMLNREKIAGAILVKDLTAPFVSLSLKSDVNLADWQGFMPENYIYKMEGDANIDAQFQNQFQKRDLPKICHQVHFDNTIFHMLKR